MSDARDVVGGLEERVAALEGGAHGATQPMRVVSDEWVDVVVVSAGSAITIDWEMTVFAWGEWWVRGYDADGVEFGGGTGSGSPASWTGFLVPATAVLSVRGEVEITWSVSV